MSVDAPRQTGRPSYIAAVARAFTDRGKAGSLGVALLLITATPRRGLFPAAIAIAAAGVLWRLWASGCVRKNKEIALRGPYGVVRHPLYLGNAILCAALLLANGNPWYAVPAALLFVYHHAREIRYEERLLLGRFPEAYGAYLREVAMIVPGPRGLLRLPKMVAQGGFSLGLVMHHREYRVALATPLCLWLLWEFDRRGEPPLWRWIGAAGVAAWSLARLLVLARRVSRERAVARVGSPSSTNGAQA